MNKGKLFVLSAPSGAGKSTLIRMIRPIFPEIVYSISCTTRPPRIGEVDGKDYYFLTKDEFRNMVENDRFIEWKIVHGNMYGTPAEPVEQALGRSADMILDIDVQGAIEVFKRFPESISIFISAPDMETLENRLRLRHTDSEESIRTRLKNAILETEMAKIFKYRIVNDDLKKAVEDLVSIIRRESDTY